MKRIASFWVIVIISLFIACSTTVAASLNNLTSNAVLFVLDVSNSMNSNDRSRLAIDSIAQLIYSLPSNYSVGVVAYNTDVVVANGMADSEGRDSIMEAANTACYIGYTNAGAGLTRAMEMLETVNASQKTVVMLSDGEIIMQNDTATAVSSAQFASAVAQAKGTGVKIHVIGLGADMENRTNTIFSAAVETGGTNYHAPKAEDIQRAVDAILLEQLNVKKTTAAVVDADGGAEELNLTIPSANVTTARILFISESPIQNFKADFNADNVRQISGTHYTLLELDHPTGKQVHVSFQGAAGSQVKVDVITEYHVTMIPHVAYEDVEPAEEDATHYERTAQINVSFYDVENPERQVLTDFAFEGKSLSGTIDGQEWSGSLKSGTVSLPPQSGIAENQMAEIVVAFDNLETNIIVQQPLTVSLEGAPELPVPPPPPEPPDYRPYIIIGGVMLLGVVVGIVFWINSKRKYRPVPIPESAPPPPASKYDYTGRLSIYITKTRSEYDIPPLTYNLFRLPGSKVLSLQEVLDSCNVEERFEGADQIFFRPGAGRCLILTNSSDCTLMQNREILIKNRSYQIELNSKVDITFEDEISELALQYKDVKPSGTRLLAGAR